MTVTLSDIGTLYKVLILGPFYTFGTPTVFALSAHPSDCKHKDARERALLQEFDIGKCYETFSIRIISVKICVTQIHIKNYAHLCAFLQCAWI